MIGVTANSTEQEEEKKNKQSVNNRWLRELCYKLPNSMPFFNTTAHLKN